MPDVAYPAFREALAAMREGVLVGEGGAARLRRRMVERVLGACIGERGEETASLLALLKRFAVEAAREEARLFCDDLVAEADIIDADQSQAEVEPAFIAGDQFHPEMDMALIEADRSYSEQEPTLIEADQSDPEVVPDFIATESPYAEVQRAA